jgi:hypothetical protein
MKISTKLTCCIAAAINTFVAYSQTTTINYLTSGLSTTSCNVFNPSVNIGGVTHSSLAGGVTFNITEGIVLSTSPFSVPPGGTAFYLSYLFTPGYNYDISITAKATNSSLTLNTSVVPNLTQFPTNGTALCSPDPNVTSYQLVGVGQLSMGLSTTSTIYSIPQFNTGYCKW